MRISAKVVAAVAAVLTVPAIMLITPAIDCKTASGGDCADAPVSLPKDAIYTGGATIIGLAAFGSVIGARVITGKNEKIEYPGAILMIGGAVGVIIIQGFVMWDACCTDLNQTAFRTYIIVTTVSSILIILGFSHIVSELFRLGSKNQDRRQPPAQDDKQDDKQDEEQSGAQGGATTELHFRFKSGRGTSDMSFNHSWGKS